MSPPDPELVRAIGSYVLMPILFIVMLVIAMGGDD